MEFMRKTLVAMSLVAAGTLAQSASAQDEGGVAEAESSEAMPRNYTQRPITLRARTLRVDAAPSDFGLMDSGAILGPIGSLGSYGFHGGQRRTRVDTGASSTVASDAYGGMGLGASYGIVDRLEVGALVLPINFDDGNAFGNMAVYVRAALVEGDVSLGIQGTVSLPTWNDLGVGAGLPINVRIGESIRLETGIEGEFFFDIEDDTNDGLLVNVDVPFAMSFGIGDGFVGGRTGVTMVDLGGANAAYIPVGAIGGYSLPAGPTLLDLKGSFTWTFEADGNSTLRGSFWSLMLGANVHFDL